MHLDQLLDQLRRMPEFVGKCAKLYVRTTKGTFRRDDAALKENLQKIIKPVFSVLADSAMCSLPQEVQAAIEHRRPGYVVFQVDQLRVFVPYFLANVFPYGDSLRAICNLGAQLQIGTDSVICVSGSTCQLQLGLPVGDLDFCEYLPTGDSNLPGRLLNKLIGEAQQPFCYRLVLGKDNEWTRPWSEDLLSYAGPRVNTPLQAALATPGFKQCAFVVELPGMGVLDATNVLVLLDYANTELGEAKRSFAAQEAPLTADQNWTPRDLSSPLALGEYVVWLLKTTHGFLNESDSQPRYAVKAVRRALCATRLLFLRGEGSDLVSLLKDDGARLAALFDRCKLYATISDIQDAVVQHLMPKLMASINQIRGHTMKEAVYYGRLTEEELKGLRKFRDRAVPKVSDILSRTNRLLDIDLAVEGACNE